MQSNPGQDASSFYFRKIPQLRHIQTAMSVQQFLYTSRQRDIPLQFELLSQLTDSQRHKMLLHSTSAQERNLNRYRDDRIYEHSRVKLNKVVRDKYKDIDYINANIVFDEPFKIILTQGPKLGTIKDFYMMLRQEKTQFVIMLCNLKEDGKKKCQNYYSEEARNSREPQQLKRLEQTSFKLMQSQEISKTITVRTLKDFKTNHSFKQIHYTGWEDHSVPQKYEDITTIINLLDMKKGVTIHCSAGIGRSGALAVLLKCLKDIEKHGKVSVFQNARAVRQNRYGAIKNSMQYEFIYDYIRSYIETKKNLL